MKKWHDWAFVALLIGLAVAGGWMKARQSATFADVNIEMNQG